jgi:gliding motility-associated-like protein
MTKTNYIRLNGPVAKFTATNVSGCKGLTTTFNDQSFGDGISSIVSWQWNFGDGNIQTFSGPPFQHTYVNAGTYSVKLIVTDAGGCKDSVTVPNLIIATDPQADFYTSDSLRCPGTYAFFNNTSVGQNYTSSWDFGDGGFSTTNSPNYQYNTAGLFTVRLIITDQYGCSDTLIRPNYVKVAMPVASFTVNDSISSCTPFEVHFTNTSTYWNHLLWNLGGGNSVVPNPVQFYSVPGTYNVYLVAYSPGECTDTARTTITVYDTTGASVNYLPLNGCKPLGININAFSPGPMDLYTWDFGDGTLLTTSANNTSHVYNFFGNFVPKVILTDPAGCVIPVNGLDTIRIIGATVNFGLDKKFYCDSGWVNFTDSTLFNDPLTSYNWNFGDGTTSNIQNPSHYYTSPGIYSVSLNVTTQNACVDTFTLENVVKIVESPLVRIDGDSVICVNDSLFHLGVFQRPDTSSVKWAWQFPNGNTSVLQNPLAQQYKNAGNFVVTTVATNSSGCKDTATKNIKVNALPTVTMPASITKQAGFPVTLPANYSSGVVNWNWNPAATLDCQTCPKPIADPKFNTNYTVSFVDSNGCKNTGYITVFVICKDGNVFVPNTFSPNNDGSNDVFYVRGKGLVRVKSIRIFNRWGEVVFEQQNFPVNNPAYGWNGTYKGNKPVPDVYVYQVEVFCENSQLIQFEGNVALIQ